MKIIQKRDVSQFILWLIVFLYILWIFSNSLQTGAHSGSISEKAAHFLLIYVNKAGFAISFDRFHFYVRKLAHFSEYALLGFLTVPAIHRKPLFQSKVLNYFSFGMITPLLDEGIQLFTDGRDASLRDCCIDFSGYLFGSLIIYILLLIIADIRHHQKKTVIDNVPEHIGK